MISPSFEAPNFFDVIHDKSYPEILALADEEVRMAEARSSRVKGAVAAREQGSGQYSAVLKCFLFFMRYGIKPGGVLEEDFAMFRPVCERLVEKGQFKSYILEDRHGAE
jgi:hypothetical protein